MEKLTMEKLTKTERRILEAARLKKAMDKALGAGYRPHRPGDVVKCSDRMYIVQRDGSLRVMPPEVAPDQRFADEHRKAA